MTQTTTPYNISITETERRRSGDSSNSELSTIHHRASDASSTSASASSAYGRSSLEYINDAPPPYAENGNMDDEDLESAKKMEEEKKLRIRDYAIEISRLMGRQLVNGMKNGTTKSNSHTSAATSPAADTASH